MNWPQIRPSALPKLDESPCFVGAGGESSEAAARGTLIDSVWRDRIAHPNFIAKREAELAEEDKPVVVWALDKAFRICGNSPILTNEADTKLTHEFFENEFTADLICPEKAIVIDLKTGQLRNYRAQLAAYCLALMEKYWLPRAEGIALFCDQQEAVHYEFSYDTAKHLVLEIVEKTKARKPDELYPGDYCGWCKFADTCPTRTEPALAALEVVQEADTMSLSELRENLLADPIRLGEFWKRYKLFEKEIAKPVGEAMRAKLDAGENIPGWRIQYEKGREYFDSEALAQMSTACTPEELITLMGGKVSGKTFREFCAVKGLTVNEALARSGAQIAKLMPEKKKKGK